ncbi:MAG: hypothetical protein IIA60_14220, partial [Candidatus Marinimicrobia bacterium]|nr:hypothetical protein [Candidatus Neomarinimicrobiota bacterium]
FIGLSVEELWPVGYNTGLADFEYNFNEKHYEIDDPAVAEFWTSGLPNTPFYIRSTVAGHSAGYMITPVLGNEIIKAVADMSDELQYYLLIQARIENAGGLPPSTPVVTFHIYEDGQYSPDDPPPDDDHEFRAPLAPDEEPLGAPGYLPPIPAASCYQNSFYDHSLVLTVADFNGSEQDQWVWHDSTFRLHSYATPNCDALYGVRSRVEVEWHGNVDFYLDEFQLHSTYNHALFHGPDQVTIRSDIQSNFQAGYDQHDLPPSSNSLFRWYQDEIRLTAFHAFGELTQLARSQIGDNDLGIISSQSDYRVQRLDDYQYFAYGDPREFAAHFYPIGGDGGGRKLGPALCTSALSYSLRAFSLNKVSSIYRLSVGSGRPRPLLNYPSDTFNIMQCIQAITQNRDCLY